MEDGVSRPVIDCRTMKPIGSNIVWGLVVAGLRRQNLDGDFLSANDAKRDWGSFLTTAAMRAAETTGPCGTAYFTSVCYLRMVKQLKEWATLGLEMKRFHARGSHVGRKTIGQWPFICKKGSQRFFGLSNKC